VPVGRKLRGCDVNLVTGHVLQNDIHGLFPVVVHVAVQVPHDDAGLREKPRSRRGVLANDRRGAPETLAVRSVSDRFVSVGYTAHRRVEAVVAVQDRVGFADFGVFRVHVPGKHWHVHDRDVFHNSVPNARQQVFQNQPGPGTSRPGNRASVDEHHRKDRGCRTPGRIRRGFLPAERTLDRERRGDNTYQTPVDSRRRLRVD